MNNQKNKIAFFAAWLMLINCLTSHAENISPPSVLKNIQENSLLPNVKDNLKVAPEEIQDTSVYINKLLEVKVDNPLLNSEIKTYWKGYVNKTITNQDVSKFKEWAWSEFRRVGYFAFLTTDVLKSGDGDILVINVNLPKVRKIKVISNTEQLASKYEEIISKRLSKKIKAGGSVDVLALEQQLDDLGFDLPLSLDMNIRPVGADQVDLIVNVNEKNNKTYHLSNGILQFNNYGLKQYGREQALGSISLFGLTQGSIATLTAQKSEGVNYVRLDYEAPSELLRGHYRLYGSDVSSHSVLGGSAASDSDSNEFGLGTTHILSAYRDMVFTSYIDLSKRNTYNYLMSTGYSISQITDNQIKFRLTADNEKQSTKNSQRYEITFFDGDDNRNGHYSKVELLASTRNDINDNGLIFLTHAKAQILPDRNLDIYNRISLGGVNGVRAYTTIDGVGDQGGVVSLDLRQQVGDNKYIGAFYDAGIVKQNKNAILGAYNSSYILQGAGFEIGGYLNKFNYSLSLAKAIGDYDAYNAASNVESSPHNWRANLAISYPF